MNKVILKKISHVLLIGAVVLSCSCSDSSNQPEEQKIPSKEGYELIWNDEFDSNQIDLEKWEYEVNANGGGNNELQYYTSRKENSFIENGKLIIKAINEVYEASEGRRNYTSARLRTKNKGDWKYGRFEIRAKLPIGQGIWPAIWMLPTDWEFGGWPLSGEIDIMELIGHQPSTVYGTLHYGSSFPNNVHTGSTFNLSSGTFANDFHTFAIEWEEGIIRWYVDDELYQTQTKWHTDQAPFPAPFNKRFHLLLNVAVGGNWPGSPDQTTAFPQQMEVDYVRVFKKN